MDTQSTNRHWTMIIGLTTFESQMFPVIIQVGFDRPVSFFLTQTGLDVRLKL